MNQKPWIGNNLNKKLQVLILGESHYDEENSFGAEVTFATSGVVEYYFKKRERWAQFFDKMAASFGYSVTNARVFYDQVYFGNYVDVVCGVGNNNCAKHFINLNRKKYNTDLFKYVNDKGIHVIICFSKQVYHSLPKLGSKDEFCSSESIGKIGGKNNILGVTFYLPDVEHGFCDVKLQKGLKVYGVRHPSAKGGYNSEQVYQYMKKQEDVRALCKV